VNQSAAGEWPCAEGRRAWRHSGWAAMRKVSSFSCVGDQAGVEEDAESWMLLAASAIRAVRRAPHLLPRHHHHHPYPGSRRVPCVRVRRHTVFGQPLVVEVFVSRRLGHTYWKRATVS
jgi:hypothetical protein